MTLWWIGNAIFLLVIIPVVVLLLQRLWRVVSEIKQYGDDALEHGVLLIAAMDHLEQLIETREAVTGVRNGVERYGAALEEIL